VPPQSKKNAVAKGLDAKARKSYPESKIASIKTIITYGEPNMNGDPSPK
jgi:hypothetical protein